MQIRSKFVVVSLWSAVACGDDDGGSGVSSTKQVGDLSTSEARAFCRSLATKLDDINSTGNHFSCVGEALGQANGSQSTCETLRKQCEADDSDDDALDCDGADGETGGVSGECADVTVGELNDCIDATKKQLDDLKSKVTCSAELSDLVQLESTQKAPAACTTIAAKCPDFEDMGGSMGGSTKR